RDVVQTRPRPERTLRPRPRLYRPQLRALSLADVLHHLELQQGRTGGDGLPVALMGVLAAVVGPRAERFLGLPLGHHEIALLALGGAQQLEADEAGGVLHGAGAVGETLLQLGARALVDFDGIDLHDAHATTVP